MPSRYRVPVLRTVRATRYVTPLREGGSLPGLVEADDDGMYVVKFRGAGQGTRRSSPRSSSASSAGASASACPTWSGWSSIPASGCASRTRRSRNSSRRASGSTWAWTSCPGRSGYDGVAGAPDPFDAARVFWLDAYTANIDRTWRNPNLLVWHRTPLGDRPRRGPGLPARVAGARRCGPAAATTSRSTCCCRSSPGSRPPTSPRLDAELSAAVPGLLPEVLALVPDAWFTGMNAALGDPRGADAWRERYVGVC